MDITITMIIVLAVGAISAIYAGIYAYKTYNIKLFQGDNNTRKIGSFQDHFQILY